MTDRPPSPDAPAGGAGRGGSPVPLARLLAMAYRWMIEQLHQQLADQHRWEGLRPAYGFVLLALRHEPLTTTELAAALDVSKQAASKLADAMVAASLLERVADPADGRRHHLRLARAGRRLLADVEQVYADLEREWAEQIGADGVDALRTNLTDGLVALHRGALPTLRPVV